MEVNEAYPAPVDPQNIELEMEQNGVYSIASVDTQNKDLVITRNAAYGASNPQIDEEDYYI